MEIIEGFTNSRGEKFPLIENYSFESWDEFRNTPKTFVAKTTNNLCEEFGDNDEDGMHIWYLNDDPTIGFRVYSECGYCTYMYTNFESDAKFLQKLQEYQPKIKLSEFPYGVISVQNKVIGQVMKFYHKYKTLLETFHNNKIMTIEEAYNIYFQIIEILTELQENGIIYNDPHTRNFMYNLDSKDVRAIDFEHGRLKFDGYTIDSMVNNLQITLNRLNEMLNISEIHNLRKTATLSEIEEAVKDDYHIRTRKA